VKEFGLTEYTYFVQMKVAAANLQTPTAAEPFWYYQSLFSLCQINQTDNL
jgi:hypothetical protein